MATTKHELKHPSKSSGPDSQKLCPPTQSSSYHQARRNWRDDWQAVFEQCSDFFVRY